MAKEKKPRFEEALKRLEEIVARMEDENLALDRALELYEEGIGLTRLCTRMLDAAEKRIEVLAKNPDGTATAVPFDGGAGAEAVDAPARGGRPRGGAPEEGGLLL
ncbi:MAG: exodeoxyribonuclease VII small subunit [bacterium]|nr:exodeoxyribonuclease VII small subunit [bacterium]